MFKLPPVPAWTLFVVRLLYDWNAKVWLTVYMIPAELTAWLTDSFCEWTDCGGDVEKRFTKDELLTNIPI